MDALTDALDALRLKSSLYCRAFVRAPWGLHFLPSARAIFHVIDTGNCWLHLAGEPSAIPLASGDVLILAHGNTHQITDSPTTPASIEVEVGRTLSLDYQTLDYTTAGEGPRTSLLCGLFEVEQSHPLFSLLPPLIHIPGEQGRTVDWLESVLKMLMSEADARQPGANIVIKRLADILLIKVIRFWVEHQAGENPGWVGALRDAQMSTAIALMHRMPEHPWSVASLAKEVAMSRSAFSARFRALVGMPPLTYLTLWRMHTAALLLQQRNYDLKGIASVVGYESEFALSKAFKRQFGIAPRAYRAQSARSST